MLKPDHPAGSPYWRKTLLLSRSLLGIWLVVTVSVCWFGRSLDVNFLGWPFGFWATSQGALIIFCLIVWYYAWAMNRLDEEFGGDDID